MHCARRSLIPGILVPVGLTLALTFALTFLKAPTVSAETPEPAKAPEAGQQMYVRQVKPLLQSKCVSCHGPLQQEGELRLDTVALAVQGGASGAAIVPGKPEESLLIEKVVSEDEFVRMPPADGGAALTGEQVALLRRWIAAGAAAPKDETAAADPSDHWAFQPPAEPSVPIAEAPWVRTDLDRFIAAEHARRNLQAVAPAPPEILLRRVYLNLTGLPPSREQLRNFLADPSPEAYERVVDELLASPRYGERWARHWMDVWRYSDPSGYGQEIRDSREHIWRWRDWIIDSLNRDTSYDRMIRDMLAADEASPGDLDAARATGFLARNWYKFNRNVWLDNIVEHSSKAFLGMTLNCARCHDHKYDPVRQAEYYRLRAVFETHDVRDDPWAASPDQTLVRAYDAHLDRATYRFEQGDENRPVKDEPLEPAVPSALGGSLDIQPIELPVEAWYPALRADRRQAHEQSLQAQLEAARDALREAEAQRDRTREQLAARQTAAEDEAKTQDKPAATPPENDGASPGEQGAAAAQPAGEEAAKSPPAEVLARDSFDQLDDERWRVEGGTWSVKEGRVRQTDGQSKQFRLVSQFEHPRDFRVRLRMRIQGGEQYRSAGIGFDIQGQRMNAVYLSAGGSKVQVTLQNAQGGWAYPAEGAASYPVEVERDYQLELAVRADMLHVLVDGKPVVRFRLPGERQPGRIALWTFSADAEFDDLLLETLPRDLQLAGIPSAALAAPEDMAAPEDVADALEVAEADLRVARRHLATREAELAAWRARVAAESVKYDLQTGDPQQLARQAAQAHSRFSLCQLEEQVARDEHQLLVTARQAAAGDAKAGPARDKAEKDLAAHKKQLADARAKQTEDSTDYPALGPLYPRTSSGRRLAYAQWITSPRNPLTARVAVNHVWMRHFDEPLVERVFDFGLRSERPPLADLLDWLAIQFMRDGWSMKKLHKRIVMSGLYRLSSSTAEADAATLERDPDNHAFWHVNARRMEAEVVRDSLLHVGDSLDETMGGPPIDHQQGQTVARRSIYFRQDKERQMTFLGVFDGAKVNECYRRKATVAPQQALAMFNSQVAWSQAQKLAQRWTDKADDSFVEALFEHVLCRRPSDVERSECLAFLADLPDPARARRQLALVLLNHHDFVTIR